MEERTRRKDIEFVRQKNLELYRSRLAEAKDEAERLLLLKLLAAEERKMPC